MTRGGPIKFVDQRWLGVNGWGGGGGVSSSWIRGAWESMDGQGGAIKFVDQRCLGVNG